MSASIFNGTAVKILKDILRSKSGVQILFNSVDPTSIATSANAGDILISTNGFLYQKQGSGSSTNWTKLVRIELNGGVEIGPSSDASGTGATAIGNGVTASGSYSHAEGNSSTPGTSQVASGLFSHVEGSDNVASGVAAHAEGAGSTASGDYSHSEASGIAGGTSSHAEGSSHAANDFSHAEGHSTLASNYAAHSEGDATTASGNSSHSEGFGTESVGDYSHAEGEQSYASGQGSHAENRSTASGKWSHSEGNSTESSGQTSHAEGHTSIASGVSSHAEGDGTSATGDYSHSEGLSTNANGDQSHSAGLGTIADADSQTVVGTYNIPSGTPSIPASTDELFTVGNGSSLGSQSNAFDISRDSLLRSYGGQRSAARVDTGTTVSVNARTDYFVICTNASAIVVNLPAGIDGMEYIIGCSAASGGATLAPNGVDLVDNGASLSAGTVVELHFKNGSWYSTGVTDERIEDVIGNILTDSSTIDFTYNDGANTITAIVIDGSITFAKMQNISTDSLIGRDTTGTGSPEEISVGGGLEFTGSASIQRSALTGDITASAGSNSTTIANDAVSNTKLANMADSTIKGRAVGAGTGDPTDLTSTQATEILNTVVGDSGSGGTKGLVPAPSSGDTAANKFLKADGTFKTVDDLNMIGSADRDAEVSVGSWAAYADAAGTSPVDMTGGSPNTTITRTTTSGEILRGSGSFKLTKNSGASRQGEGVSVSFTVPPAAQGKQCLVRFPYKVTSGSVTSGDFKVFIYDVTNTTLITPVLNDIDSTSGTLDAYFTSTASAGTPANQTYRVGIHIATTTDSSVSIVFDDVQVFYDVVNQQVRISSYMSGGGSRVTGSAPTALGQYRSYLRNASANTYTETNGSPGTSPSVGDGILIYRNTAWGTVNSNNQPSKYDIFVGKSKNVKVAFYDSTTFSGNVDATPLAFSSTVMQGYAVSYDEITGVVTVVAPTDSGRTSASNTGIDENGAALTSNLYFDIFITNKSSVSTALNSEVYLDSGNGWGSTNTKIRRFSNIRINTGSDITYADSSTAGGSFTINTSGIYMVYYGEVASAGTAYGISVNSSQLTTNIGSVTFANGKRAENGINGSTVVTTLCTPLVLTAGDIVRAHTDGVSLNAGDDTTIFHIVRIA